MKMVKETTSTTPEMSNKMEMDAEKMNEMMEKMSGMEDQEDDDKEDDD